MTRKIRKIPSKSCETVVQIKGVMLECGVPMCFRVKICCIKAVTAKKRKEKEKISALKRKNEKNQKVA